MIEPTFFGYGSLVNLGTHNYSNPRRGQVDGWRRVWRHTKGRERAILSVQRDDVTQLHGVFADVPQSDWSALDAREAAYTRQRLSDGAAIYEVTLDIIDMPERPSPILLSYLDVVVQGYLRTFGAPEALHFFATTDGWDAPILNDRAAPHYPRAQVLTPSETAFVDTALTGLAAQVQDLHEPGLALERVLRR